MCVDRNLDPDGMIQFVLTHVKRIHQTLQVIEPKTGKQAQLVAQMGVLIITQGQNSSYKRESDQLLKR